MRNYLVAMALVLAATVQARTTNGVITQLQETSVTVDADTATGSGVLFSRDDTTYVLTAAHVVEAARRVRQVIDPRTGNPKSEITFLPVSITQPLVEGGRPVGRLSYLADIVKYSDSDHGEDLAVLRVLKRGLTKTSAAMYLDKDLPALGDELLNIGSPMGEKGAGTLVNGIYSQYGRTIAGHIYDVATTPARGGASGSGVFLKDGRCVGIVCRVAGETYTIMAPARRIMAWAKKVGVDWIFDPSLKKGSDAGTIEDPDGAATIAPESFFKLENAPNGAGDDLKKPVSRP